MHGNKDISTLSHVVKTASNTREGFSDCRNRIDVKGILGIGATGERGIATFEIGTILLSVSRSYLSITS